MRLRAKTLLIVGATFVGLTLLMSLAARTVVMAGFDAIEVSAVQEHVERARRALSEDVMRLAETARDYAAWDATYRYVQTRDPSYLAQDLPTEDQPEIGVAVVVIADLEGTVLHERLIDFEGRRQLPLPPDLARRLKDERFLLRGPAPGRDRAGVLAWPGSEWIVAFSPILDNTRSLPARGTLVMGRPLDSSVVRAIAERTRLQLSIQPLPDLPSDEDSTDRGVVRPLSDDLIEGRVIVKDVHATPALGLTIRMPREIHQRARTVMTWFTVSLLLVGLVFGGTILRLFEALVLARLERLSDSLRAIREMRELGARVDDSGRDELSDLGGSINRLLETVEGSQRELREQRDHYSELFHGNPHAMWVYEPASLRLLDVNSAALAQYGYARDEFLGLCVTDLHPEQDRRALLSAGIWRQLKKDGTPFHAEIARSNLLFAGSPACLVMAHDVTSRVAAERALRESEERYALAARAANDGLWDWDVASGHVYFSPRWKALLGYQDPEIAAEPEAWLSRVHPEDRTSLQAKLQTAASDRAVEHEHRILHRDGSYRHVLCRWVTLRSADGGPLRRVGSLSDVSPRKAAEERLRHEALYDQLTGLPNRTLLLDRLRQALIRTARHPEQSCCLLFLDLDRFKLVNDSLGHSVGDQLLRDVARRIERCVRPEDTVARLGGDEFIVLLQSVNDPKDATRAAERIQSELGGAFHLGELEVFTSASIGIAFGGRGYQEPDDLTREGETAMYRAKASGKARFQVFDSRMHAQATLLLNAENDLRRAIERSEFELLYQPIVELERPAVVGFEALLRWRHPARGLVAPDEFIPLAEETGLIVPIGRWVLERACADAQRWHKEHRPDPPVTLSVNFSARQLMEVDLLDAVGEVLKRTDLDPNTLRIEVTESVIMQRPDHVAAVLGRLKRLGIRVSIDDFGTGYSSLSYLHVLPVDSLKIDRSFISTMQRPGRQRQIIKTIVTLARGLGIEVIAEGVEKESQRRALQKLGCDLAQGFLFSKPLESEAAGRLLASSREAPSLARPSYMS